MKFTLPWLKEHLDTTASLAEIVDKLTMIGLEVEAVEDKTALLKPFVIASVVSAEKHPNADRLRVCMVDTGTGQPIQVVCGAPNARAGIVGIAFSDRRVGRQVDDAVMVVGDHQLGLRQQHAAAFDVANFADRQRHVLAGDERTGRGEYALHAGARIGRTAHHLDWLTRSDVDHAHPEAIGVGMLLCRND